MKRAVIIVLDSLGVGALPDAARFGEADANTLGHLAEVCDLRLPQLQRLGLANILPLRNLPPLDVPLASYGKMASRAGGMDSTSGHWEMAGLLLDAPFPTYPQGFPLQLLDAFAAASGRGWLGNCAASGLQIIEDYGAEQMRTGKWIVYTSADSVFQVAAHEEVIPLAELYHACELARQIFQGPHAVGRVIARPFVGMPGAFRRTEGRRDFSLPPPAGGLLAAVEAKGLPVVSVGKIWDLFAAANISRALPAHNNQESLEMLLQALRETAEGLIFANFVDFDMLYGHRNDPAGYAAALMAFDRRLPELLALLRAGDLLLISADHGNDPTTPSTDHNREYVPLLAYGPGLKAVDLGLRASFADLGATAAAHLQTALLPHGESFLGLLHEDPNREAKKE